MPVRNLRRSHTVSLVRFLRAVGQGKRPRKRLPRQQHPDGITREYFNAIRPVCEQARAAFNREAPEIVRLLTALRARQGREDATTTAPPKTRARDIGGDLDYAVAEGKAAGRLVDKAAVHFAGQFSPDAMHAVAKKFGRRTSDFQRAQLDAQVRAAVGIPFSAIEKPTRDKLDEFAAVNVDLIVSMTSVYFDRISGDVQEAFETGMHPSTLSDLFQERYEMSERQADLIARDQVSKLAGDLNQERQESIGVTHYVWRTGNDERVRENHAVLDGQTFAWDDPPMGGGTNESEEGNPGFGISCRCSGDPDLEDIINGTVGQQEDE